MAPLKKQMETLGLFSVASDSCQLRLVLILDEFAFGLMIASLFASGDTRQVQTLPDGLTKTDCDHEKTTDLEGDRAGLGKRIRNVRWTTGLELNSE